MTVGKRLMDLVLALVLSIVLAPVILLVSLAILILDGGPVLYKSERMKTPTQGFALWKFRTMRPSSDNAGVSGGDKSDRITRTGHILRRTRLDELPQLWNILRGDISFVGPRPPLRQYTEQFPDLYARVLRAQPGVTGLATLVYHRTEERLLAACTTPEQTDRVYARRCVPRKATLDLLYARKATRCSDMRLMLATVFRGIGVR